MGRPKSVMIVEDDADIRNLVSQIVEMAGFEPVTACDGLEASEKLNDKNLASPCLILLDLMMPRMNGWEFLQARRVSDIIAAIPVVVVSATPDERGSLRGARKILRKPMDLEALLHEVEEFCGTAGETLSEFSEHIEGKKPSAA